MARPAQRDVLPIIASLPADPILYEDERAAVRALPMRIVELATGEDIVREGNRSARCCALLEGFACTYWIRPDGQRQITAFHLPGDVPDLRSLYIGLQDRRIGALTTCRVGYIEHDGLRDLAHAHPRLADAMWREILRDEAISRAWVVRAGQPGAIRRAAHLICELAMRSRAAGLGRDDTSEVTVRAVEIGDALRLSPGHVTRTLQKLETRGWISLAPGLLVVHCWGSLKETADFDPSYLQLGGRVLG